MQKCERLILSCLALSLTRKADVRKRWRDPKTTPAYIADASAATIVQGARVVVNPSDARQPDTGFTTVRPGGRIRHRRIF